MLVSDVIAAVTGDDCAVPALAIAGAAAAGAVAAAAAAYVVDISSDIDDLPP